MKKEDLDQMEEHFSIWTDLIKQDVKEICLLSPVEEERIIIKKLFPEAWITESSENDWNLLEKSNNKFDLILACNLFMYSSNPQVWFDNILNSCKYLWIQDLIRGQRMQDCELGDDGDKTRFCYPPNYLARVENAFDLHKLWNKIRKFVPYFTQSGISDKDCLSFLLFVESK